MGELPDRTEQAIRAAFDGGAHDQAATLAIELYGHEIFSFVGSQLREQHAASDAFSDFSELFWRTLPRFEWRCSLRTWMYLLARRALSRERRDARKRIQHETELTKASLLPEAVERVRTQTALHMQTAMKDRFQNLRAELSEEDQIVLVLRVDRDLSWLELAEVMLASDTPPTHAQLTTEAARLRKRFQLAKAQLRKRAEETGLVERQS
jgi:RNA polymerase sigma-70 factor (ECF subfamily)